MKLDIQRFILTNLATFDITLFIVLIILVILSAFFSMSETVFSSVSELKLRTRVENREPGAKKALYLAENFDMTLTTLLVGNNLVNISLSVLSVTFFSKLIISGRFIELISTVSVTVILLIFGEIIPKTLGKKYAENIAVKISFITYIISIIMYPVVIIFRYIQKLVTGKQNKTNINETELEQILDSMEEDGAIESDEAHIIRNVFDLNDRSVEDIMTHRMELMAIAISTPIDEVKELLFENKYSRIPVYKHDKDHIIGVLYEREFLTAYIENKDFNLEDILRQVKYVSKAMKVGTLI
ncbi:MAG: hemolysin family protein, partial [Anaeroplasmataceae bacterium]